MEKDGRQAERNTSRNKTTLHGASIVVSPGLGGLGWFETADAQLWRPGLARLLGEETTSITSITRLEARPG